mmetsp:Transcript_1240/g.2839  ORF Transcript_1240/g.2839 Transcript_1240/m.2839 type:complete len:212 (-) Transcript_1240:987-1622(-)
MTARCKQVYPFSSRARIMAAQAFLCPSDEGRLIMRRASVLPSPAISKTLAYKAGSSSCSTFVDRWFSDHPCSAITSAIEESSSPPRCGPILRFWRVSTSNGRAVCWTPAKPWYSISLVVLNMVSGSCQSLAAFREASTTGAVLFKVSLHQLVRAASIDDLQSHLASNGPSARAWFAPCPLKGDMEWSASPQTTKRDWQRLPLLELPTMSSS